jgi:D-3-phosphoglycerate dehydrogenase
MNRRKRILVPGLLVDEAESEQTLGRAADVELVYGLSPEDRALGFSPERREERMQAVAEALDEHLPTAAALHGMGVTGHMPVTAEMMDRAGQLEVIFVQAAGTDMIDVDAATERGILVVNAPGANAPAVAEHAVGLMLALTRQIAEADRRARRGDPPAPVRLTGPRALTMLAGKTLGVIGYGFVGRTLADLCRRAFSMPVLAYDPFYDGLEAARQGTRLVEDLDELLGQADVVSVNTPLTAATRHIIDARALGLMRPSSILLNTGRGGSVDTDALVVALREERIAGAGLDVTDPEPLPPGHPLFDLDNVVVTPHVGGGAREVMAPTARTANALLLDALRGRRPRHLVNPAAWARHAERFGAVPV